MTYHNRHECKFVVPESLAGRLLQQVRPFIEPDPYAARRHHHVYPIASLYLDDANGTLYRETIEGRAHRFKLRIRSYTDDPSVPVFLEVKRRHDRVVQKLRAPIPRASLPAVFAADADAMAAANQGPALQEFLRLAKSMRVLPRCTVRYDRQAYVGRDDDEVRVTIDRRLCAMPESAPLVRVHAADYVTVPTGGVILELKFTDRCPPWLLDAVRALELRRGSFSKYCTSVQALATVDRWPADCGSRS